MKTWLLFLLFSKPHFFCCSPSQWTVSSAYMLNSIAQFISHVLRRSDLCIPRNETARPRSQFPHSCICEIHEYRNWERGRAVSFMRIFVSNFWDSCLCSVVSFRNFFLYYKILQAGNYYFCGNIVLKQIWEKFCLEFGKQVFWFWKWMENQPNLENICWPYLLFMI